ncbi:MAG: hypothetical protein HEP71_13215 [Roseivirga sp.]|nr:hypothetical protein [Roseivirga sp.]
MDKVFAKSAFDIEIQQWGCFGGSKEHFELTLEDDRYLLKSKSTGKSHLVSKTKIDSLKVYLKTRIGTKSNGGCTSSEYLRVGTLLHSVDYEHNYCDGMEATILNDLLNYHELIFENETEE